MKFQIGDKIPNGIIIGYHELGYIILWNHSYGRKKWIGKNSTAYIESSFERIGKLSDKELKKLKLESL